MSDAPSGRQFEIAHGDQKAVIVGVGGGIRTYTQGGRDVLEPYPENRMCDGSHGKPLIPWPNRLEDGRYTFDGREYQVDISEPSKGNAIHGLLSWRGWQGADHEADRVTMVIRLHPMKGYPWRLDAEITYALDDNGLTVETKLTNSGDKACPVGAGQHPYLSPGAGASLDDCTVQLTASARILVDDERQLPIGTEPVEGTEFDFRSPRKLGALKIDHGFRDLVRDGDGRAWVHLTGPDGRTASLWAEKPYSIIQLYTGDTLAPKRQRHGLAAEPMTCPANAFRTGEGVARLVPGGKLVARWGARLS